MNTALFIIFPVRSHVIAVLGIAKILSSNNTAVVFAGGIDQQLDLYVQQQGFETIALPGVPFGLPYKDELSFYTRLGKSKADLITDRVKGQHYSRRESFRRLLNSVNPSLIFLDSFTKGDYLCLYPFVLERGIRFFLVNTMLVSQDRKLPPVNSHLLPGQTFLIRWQWHRIKLSEQFSDWWETVFLLGNSTRSILKRRRRELNMGLPDRAESNGPASLCPPNLTELIMSSREFDFPGVSDKHKIYIGPQLYIRRNESILVRDKERLTHILATGKEFIYVSLGTLYPKGSGETISAFFKNIIQAACKCEQMLFLVSCGLRAFLNDGRDMPANVFFFETLPQTYLLSRATLFITHGGLNSIKESIYFGVPMLVYPLNPHYDQPGNAARIKYHGLGLSGDIRKDTCTEILNKIKTITENIVYRNNVNRLKQTIDEKYNGSCFMDVITNEGGMGGAMVPES